MLKTIALAAAAFSASASPQFHEPSIQQARQIYAAGTAIYVSNKDPDFNVFAEMLAKAWIDNHKQQALEKAAKRHSEQASPDDVWELPFANDWLGCLFWQIPDEEVFRQAHFATYDDHPMLLGWIEENKALLDSTPELRTFRDSLEQLPAWSAKCEDLVRKQPPDGASNI